MGFNSQEFLIFFPCTVIIYFLLPGRAKSVWLLAGSYYFYMAWNPMYIFLLMFSTLVTYISGLLLDRLTTTNAGIKAKRAVVTASLVINLGMLIYYKYTAFLADLADRFARDILHQSPVFAGRIPDIVLPVGISFFTFQALSYTIDVYRGEISAEKNIIRYALFVSFFPQLVAGPIERSKNLLVQVRNIGREKLWNYEGIIRGLILMLWGFFMKVVIADRLSVLTDPVFSDQAAYGASMRIMAIAGFAIQIYCDFAGYSTIAIGAAKVMGINLMENFNTPFFARNVKDFWNRWHISMSSWFRDYLYIPLGGSRCSKRRYYFNLFITFLASGLWHGAAAKYLVWGGLNGLLQILNRWWEPYRKRLLGALHLSEDGPVRYLEMIISFITFTLTLVVFRANSLKLAVEYYIHTLTRPDYIQFIKDRTYQSLVSDRDLIITAISIAVLLIVGLIRKNKGKTLDVFLMEKSYPVRALVMMFLLFYIILFGQYGEDVYTQPFVYFQF